MKHGEKKRASPTRKLPPQIQAALDWDSPTFKLWDEIDPLSADAITRLVSNYDEQRGKWPSHLRPHVWKRLAIDALYIHHTADNKGERPPHDVVKLWCRLADLPDHEPFLWQFREGEQDGRGDPKYKLRFAAAILRCPLWH